MFRRWSGAAGAVVLAVVLTGCGGEPAPAPDSKASPEAGAEPSASASAGPQAVGERAVLAAYEGMWRELAVAVRNPSAGGTRIEDYASGGGTGDGPAGRADDARGGNAGQRPAGA